MRGNITVVSEAKYGGTYAPMKLYRLLTRKSTDAAAVLLPAGPIDASIWKTWTTAIAAETGIKGKGLFMPLRLALTGRDLALNWHPCLQLWARPNSCAP